MSRTPKYTALMTSVKEYHKGRRIKHNLVKMMLIAGAAVAPGVMNAQDEYWHQRYTLFEKLPVSSNDIVFLGNSITDGGEFQELFGMDNILNRGIRSDRIDGVRKRLDQVVKGHPKQIFLLIGINDVADSHQTPKTLGAKYEKLVKEIREKSPETQLILQSVMPINNDFKRYKSLIGREAIIPLFNEEIERIAAENGALYVDLREALADPATGKLRKEFTNDGLHLTGAGYKAWTNYIRPYLAGAPKSVKADSQVEVLDISSESIPE